MTTVDEAERLAIEIFEQWDKISKRRMGKGVIEE